MILSYHRHSFILRFIITHPHFIRSDDAIKNGWSDRLISKNRLNALTQADFSSSVSSLGTYLVDTYDKPRSAVKTR